jgi:hypothetical protein
VHRNARSCLQNVLLIFLRFDAHYGFHNVACRCEEGVPPCTERRTVYPTTAKRAVQAVSSQAGRLLTRTPWHLPPHRPDVLAGGQVCSRPSRPGTCARIFYYFVPLCAGCQSDRMIDPFTDSHPPFLLSARTGSYVRRADSWPTHRNRQQHKQTIAATYCSCAKSRYQFLQVGESFCWCRSGANALDRFSFFQTYSITQHYPLDQRVDELLRCPGWFASGSVAKR